MLGNNGKGDSSDLIEALNFVGKYYYLSLEGICYKPHLERAISTLVVGDVTVEVAAGNDNRDANLEFPAMFPIVITVFAITDADGTSIAAPHVAAGTRWYSSNPM